MKTGNYITGGASLIEYRGAYPLNDEYPMIAQDQGEYQKRYNGLVERYEKAKARFDEVTEAIAERSAKGERLRREASPFRERGSSGRLRRRWSLRV